ncbi:MULTISPECIES: response regulator transcription factor [unclassified Bradyrhizobium]|uniref:response regulator transcription factor n=1 Tax=unclassified Bradyrhizobium TaxID=2631580 RepID=UPI00230230F1|nr:response regulator [Bradyrhizobium sp. CCBAU 45321]MDA9548841.1 chemotaxis protein CheY [Bradyrhizobium sp. CCBAU 45321]
MVDVSPHLARPSSSPQPTIFVVDDDAAVLGSLRFLLETDGFSVRTFRSGTALLNLGAAPGPDCYVIDYKMPDINGIDLTGRLRKSHRDAPVILITGYPDENISARAATAGIKDVVLKPLLDENLVKCIRHAIQDRPGA